VEKVTTAVAKEIQLYTPGAVSDFEPFIRYGSFSEFSIAFNVILRIKKVTDQLSHPA